MSAASEAPAAPIRIGPTAPGPETADEGPAALTPSGGLKPEVRLFLEGLSAERKLPLAPMVAALEGARYNATVARLIAPAPPGKKIWRSWLTYRARFVEPKRIGWGVEFYNENRDLLNQAAQRFGVPAPIIASIIGVETLYGRNMGNFRVLDALTTLAFDYPDPDKPERAAMFRGQLGDFLTLVMQGKLDLETRGSTPAPSACRSSCRQHHALCRRRRRQRPYRPDQQHQGRHPVGGQLPGQHGWQRGVPVFAPVTLPADPSAPWSTAAWCPSKAGTRSAPPAAAATRRLRRWLERPSPGHRRSGRRARGTAQYRVGTPNFFALTHYNRSYFYATAVADLAAEIEARVGR